MERRKVELDALRGIAALAVVATHYFVVYYVAYGESPLTTINLGGPAVALFFVISGYVILMTLDRSRSGAEFAIARFARLFPTFWVSVALTFLVVHLANLPGRQTTLRDAILNLTMAPSVFGAAPVDVVYWSLTVELFFYIIMGTILILGLRRYLTSILFGFMLIGAIDHFWPFSQYPLGYRLEGMMILPYWPLFFFGITFYEMHSGIRRVHLWTVAACVVVSLITGGLNGLSNCLLALIVFLATHFRILLLNNRLLLYFGAISYPLYLTHSNIGFCIIRQLNCHGMNGFVSAAIALFFATVLATLISYGVERPSHRFLRQWLLQKLGLHDHPPSHPTPTLDGKVAGG